ncbi:MAG: HDOD domain-containing protein [Desulfobacteraceae bacterium]|nr:HDOD domain-containing protein [Desulfobacteraceae bacterium]
MKKLNVYKIKPGMILGQDVINAEGRRLFFKNLELSDKEIRTLKMWGIPEVIILSASQKKNQTKPKGESEGRKKEREILDKWFQKNDRQNPVIKTVYDICLDRFENNQFEKVASFKKKKNKGKILSDGKTKDVIDIPRLLKDDIKLPALPTIFFEINEAIKNPKCSGKDIVDIVSKDTSLSATLLKIVNSAHYGLSKKVESLHYAAMALGTQQVSSLAFGITVIKYFKGISEKRVNMQSFWQHSVACAITAKTFATHVKGVNSERVFIGGLLHDIGRLILLNSYPDACNSLVNKAQILGLFHYQLEEKYFGMTHGKFGSLLAKNWNFSDKLSELIHHHHTQFKKVPPKETGLVYMSNWLVMALGIGASGENGLPRLSMNAWNALNISESILEPVVKQIDRQIVEVVKFFYE